MIAVLHIVVSLAALALAVFAMLRFGPADQFGDRPWRPNIPLAILGFGAFIGWLTFGVPALGTVPAGERGVVLRFGGVTGRVVEPGIYIVNPFLGEEVTTLNVQTVAGVVSATAASRDLQDVTTQVTVNYGLVASQAAAVYDLYRKEYADRVLTPAIQEAVKAATAQFDAENLIRQRSEVKAVIDSMLRTRMAPTHRLEALSITEFAFSDEFSNAIEQKVTATQQALKAENDLKRVEFEAKQRVEAARAEAEAIRIQAEAIQRQGGAEYVQLKAVEKWDGTLPQVMLDGGSTPFINIK